MIYRNRYRVLEKEFNILKEKLGKVEWDKVKISEKWVKWSSKNKQDSLKTKTRNDELSKQLMEAMERIDSLTRENNLLTKSNEEIKEIISKNTQKYKALKSKNKELKLEKEEIDSAAEDLFERCKLYEAQWEELLKYKENTDEIIR